VEKRGFRGEEIGLKGAEKSKFRKRKKDRKNKKIRRRKHTRCATVMEEIHCKEKICDTVL
jgi:hypothetical protein